MLDTTSITMGLPVGDLREAKEWYERLLRVGRMIEPVDGIIEFEVQTGFWLQIFESDSKPPGHSVLRFGIRDIHTAKEKLQALGVEIGEVEQVEGVVAWSDFGDPWHNKLGIYQVLDNP